MKHLTRAKHVVFGLLIVSIIVAIIFLKRFLGSEIVNDDIFTLNVVVSAVSLVQCVNLSIALYILSVLDKHLMPVYS